MSLPFCPRRGRGESPPLRRRRSSPLRFSEKLPARKGRTRLRQFACPGQPVQQKEPPVRGEPACGSSRAPVSRCSKRSRPSGSNPPAAIRVPRSAGAAKGAARQGRTRLRQFACPGQTVQKRSRPSGSNPPAAVRVPRSAGAAKGAARQGRTRLRQFVCPGQPVQQKEPPG